MTWRRMVMTTYYYNISKAFYLQNYIKKGVYMDDDGDDDDNNNNSLNFSCLGGKYNKQNEGRHVQNYG